ncbi:putative quinol monooxygenase [Haladaptatus sp. DFWS20]|uniref:putative quinol monooxygenase n=1 Tax=Haladaptatus sp. DFWS20 TaxID=3403467 RepID=UPI003EBCBF6B
MLVINAEIPVNPDERERALEIASDLSEKSRAEDGVIDYRVSIDVDDPNVLRILEQYEDQEAFDTHMEAEHTQNFLAELPSLIAGEVEANRLKVKSRAELEI